ncbi:CocE/NonD family hydrolase [Tardiphaga sp. vice278]|uniref:CocE/NonD family hydrolase n=2 Tax=Tardiphaga TaxID=1395974 RepID=UPI001FEFED75|nr:CocE/NonD family hydrolase [Tardiphaga sp. vice278]
MGEGIGMIFEKDVLIEMDDGLHLRGNVFRPKAEGRYPVIMAQGVYGKDAHFEDAFSVQWGKLLAIYPDLCENGSTGRYLRWETVDPERWVPFGYVVVQVDARGTGKSPGYLDPRSPREIQDYCCSIEWAGTQPWSNGKVGLAGISYYAFTQWAVAALKPPHLVAIMPWEGYVDYYRDGSHHGGIYANAFTSAWWPRQVLVNQHGNGDTTYFDRDTNQPSTGPALRPDQLEANRTDYPADLLRHRLDDAWYQERTPDLSRISIPVLSAGNWGGPGVHMRGNVEGFLNVASTDKWLSMHIGTHWDSFYLPEYVAIQRRFFNRFLKGENNGWDQEPRVQLAIRRPESTIRGPNTAAFRMENEFPLARTQWTRFYLDAQSSAVSTVKPDHASALEYEAWGEGVTLLSPPFAEETEFTGFVTAHLFLSSSTDDMDIFATIRIFDPRSQEVVFTGAHEPTPVTRGWLRASHRKLDPKRTLPYRAFHAHDEIQKLDPRRIYEVDVELWPTCIVFPKGYRLALTLMGKDFEFPGTPGRLLHNHPVDRPAGVASTNTICTGGDQASYLLMPLIPSAS